MGVREDLPNFRFAGESNRGKPEGLDEVLKFAEYYWHQTSVSDLLALTVAVTLVLLYV
ncbi:MAG: hypothetical protein LUC83_07895 [Clostridiales bacterium]|nr:hypothetical protein [Clostridiales bacterium]